MALTDSTFSYSEERPATPKICVGLRVLAHPDTSRIGDSTLLFEVDRAGRAELSRAAPELRSARGELSGPLETGHLSRQPLEIEWTGERLRLTPPAAASMPFEVDGVRLHGPHEVVLQEQTGGVTLLLGKHVAIWIGWMEIIDAAPLVPGLVGESSVMRKLRHEIHRIGETDMPVLLRGETGVGKEIVAASIHACSRRASAEYVAVNVAGIPPTMAASELFGHRRGAFTGATEDRPGYFVQADRGTLFLDEIGDISTEVQALLLRAIQHGVIQPLGGGIRQVNVRLIAATDSDLESAIERREFREPLLRRFSYEIRVPALRERRDDLGLLFYHLLAEHLRNTGEIDRLAPVSGRTEPWVPAAFVARLARHSWPGNVRELANVALHFVVRNRNLERGEVGPELERLLGQAPVSVKPATNHERKPEDITDEEIAAAMRAADFRAERAAAELKISRAYLYTRLERCNGVTLAVNLTEAQVSAALAQNGGDVDASAAQLGVSIRALKLQIKRLGLKPMRR